MYHILLFSSVKRRFFFPPSNETMKRKWNTGSLVWTFLLLTALNNLSFQLQLLSYLSSQFVITMSQ